MNENLSPTAMLLSKCQEILVRIAEQQDAIAEASTRFAQTIAAGRMVHLFGSGHSRIMVEEMWPRYGSFPGFHPMVELSLTYHNSVVGSNGQRQAMFLENVSGLAERILRNYRLSQQDCALIISSSGCNVVPIEMAEGFRNRGIYVAAMVSLDHCQASQSQRPDHKKLTDFANLVLDTGAPVGDSMVYLEGLSTPVSPGSTIGGCMLINSIKAEVAQRLIGMGQPPQVLTASALIGKEISSQLFESAYDEHGRRLSSILSQLIPKPRERE